MVALFIVRLGQAVAMPKIEPATTQLVYAVPNGASYVDLARDLSRVNRRLYRQGMTYVVQDVQLTTAVGLEATDFTSLSISTMGNSWMVHNAWSKAFKAWRKMQNDFSDGEGSRLKGKWADFKIYLDDSHAGGSTLDPVDGNGDAVLSGEWVYSNFVYDDAGTARSPTMHMIGSVTADSAVGLIEAYGSSRNYPGNNPDNPSEAQTGFYSEFYGVGDIDDELGDDIRDDNDEPPYDLDDYPGGADNADAPVLVSMTAVTPQQAIARAPGFIAPCGLIQLYLSESSLNSADPPVYVATAAPTHYVLITMAPGPYRGVLAAPMGQ